MPTLPLRSVASGFVGQERNLCESGDEQNHPL